jgi:23S rRNA pseudouridine2605 synthase
MKARMKPMRLNRFLARHGICSRRKADEYIQSGRVSIDGIICREVGTNVDPETEKIAFDGKILETEPPRYYILLNKPVGYVTTRNDPQGRSIVTDLLPAQYLEAGIFPVGRLDADSEGLLLLSNDGDWSQVLLHPQHQVWKEYRVETNKPLTPNNSKRLQSGVILDGSKTIPAKVTIEPSNNNKIFRIAIREGKNRQIRRMCELCGLQVNSLKRLKIGPITLGTLPVGQWRELSHNEIQAIFALKKSKTATLD